MTWDFPFRDWGDQSWMSDGECHSRPELTALFFPGRGESSPEAKEMCGRCVVRSECLEFALGLPENHDHGVWGGTSAKQRRRIRLKRRREFPDTPAAVLELVTLVDKYRRSA